MASSFVVLCCLAAVLMASGSFAAKIVALPYAGGASHVFIFSKLAIELASRGHDVTVLVAKMDERHGVARLANTNVKMLVYENNFNQTDMESAVRQCQHDPLQCTFTLINQALSACDMLFNNPDGVKALSEADVLLSDISYSCGFIAHDKFNISVRVDVSPVGFYDPYGSHHWGIASEPAFVPQLGSRLIPKLTFQDRLKNTITHGLLTVVGWKLDELINAFRQKHGISVTHPESCRKSGMYILNTDWAVEYPRQISPIAKVTGPILPEAGKPIPSDLEAFYQTASTGVVVVSLGTVVEGVISADVIQKLAEAFAKLPTKVLWKLARPAPSFVGANTKIVSWMPQNDVLADKRTVAFVTHGGMNSIQEAAFHGVPVVGICQFADQFDNLDRLRYVEMAVELDKDNITPESLLNSIELLLNDPKYRQNAKKVSNRMQDRKRTSTQEAADWIEFAWHNDGGRYMRLPQLDAAWHENNWDVAAVLTVLLLSPFVGLVMLFRCLRKKQKQE